MLTLLSSSNEIKNDVYVLNKESAPGPLGLVPFSFILIGAPLKLMLDMVRIKLEFLQDVDFFTAKIMGSMIVCL